MTRILPDPKIARASVVFFGHYGDVTRFAKPGGVCRQ